MNKVIGMQLNNLKYCVTIVSWTLLICSGPLHANEGLSEWSSWFTNSVSQHPDIVAARESMNAAVSISKGREKPLYNPELSTEVAREGQTQNYRIGLSQTIDIWDKRSTRQQEAVYSREIAQSEFEFIIQNKQAEALRALVQWQSVTKLADLARHEKMQLEALVALLKKRQQADDLSQLDADLSILNLAQKLNSLAKAEVALTSVKSHVDELLPNWTEESAPIPLSFWQLNEDSMTAHTALERRVNQFPEVAAAKAQWMQLQQSAKLAGKNAKAEPTVGFNAGKTGNENVIGLTFSIPLNVRNNFSSEVVAANQDSLAAEAQYMSLRKKYLLSVGASRAALEAYKAHFNRWLDLSKMRGSSSDELLTKLVTTGDYSTSAYLIALQQRSEGLAAGIELETQFRLAFIEWLVQSGSISPLLEQISK